MSSGLCTGASTAAQPRNAWEWPRLQLETTTLANGLRVVVAENHTVPLVLLSWTSDAGLASEPAGLEGLASMTPLLLREGTAHRSGERISRELDGLGTDVTAGTDWDSAFLNVGLLSSDFAAGVELLVDMTCAPRFPPAAIARLRQRRLAELDRRRRDPGALATDAFARALFGGEGYGRPPLGTPETVARIEHADFAAFHEVHYQPSASCLVVAGSIDRKAACDLLDSFEVRPPVRTFAPPPGIAPPTMEPAGGVLLVHVPSAAQAEIRVGHRGVPRDSADLAALDLLNSILGRGPSSRLAERLRHQAGLTYHVRSRFPARRSAGMFVVETSVAAGAAGAVVQAIRREIEKLRDELVPPADLEEAKRRVLGAELRRWQDLVAVGVTLGAAALHGDPVRDLERRKQAMARVDPVTLREVARRRFHPERLVAVVAGRVDALGSQLSSGAGEMPIRPLESTS